MQATRALRQAAHAAERTPLIRFIGKRHEVPAKVDHTPRPHPASPTGKLPEGFGQSSSGGPDGNSHGSFSSYRQATLQYGPLSKSIGRIGGSPGAKLGPVEPPQGQFFDRSDLPSRFRRTPIDLAEIEAVESGGAALLG